MTQDADAAIVQVDIPCRRCGYSLLTLPLEGRCPECGDIIRPSLRGRTLAHAPRRWLRRILLGASLFGVGMLALAIGMINVMSWYIQPAVPMLAAADLLTCIGAILLILSEPGGPYFDDRRALRRIIAIAILIGLACYAIFWSGTAGQRFSPSAIQLVTVTIGILSLLLSKHVACWYLASLAARLPNRNLKIAGRLAGLSFPIFFIATLVVAAARIMLPQTSVMMLLTCALATPAIYSLAWATRVQSETKRAESLR